MTGADVIMIAIAEGTETAAVRAVAGETGTIGVDAKATAAPSK